MDKNEIKKRIESLRSEINHHRYLYHVLDRSEISDGALDSLKDELSRLEKEHSELITPDSPTQRVGGEALGKFEKVRHKTRMYSLFDAFSEKDMIDWEERNIKILKNKNISTAFSYYAELKLDGIAMSLKYFKASLEFGATRGNGETGENVTNNIKTIESIPLSLRIPKRSELEKNGFSKIKTKEIIASLEADEILVRGEVIMNLNVFNSLNKKYKKAGKAPLANPRNGVAGSIRQLDSEVVAERKLDFFAYEIITPFFLEKHEQKSKLLHLLGFKTLKENKVCNSLKEIFEFYSEMGKKRDKLAFEIDGVVVKINNLLIWEKLGIVGKGPRFMMAYKFPAVQKTTKLKDVVWQVGRTGTLTPTAVMDPVEVGGVVVSRSTIHNMDEIKRLDLKIGDTVIIERAGDVIPKIVKVLSNLRNGQEKNIKEPNKCPVCGGMVKRAEGEVAYKCASSECYAVNLRKLAHWTGKTAVDIPGLGEKIIEQLVNEGLIRDVASIYSLKEGDLLGLERFAEKSANNLIKAIEDKKAIDVSRFIFGLGIHHVGEETAITLAKDLLAKLQITNYKLQIKNISKYFVNLKIEEIEQMKDIGPIVAKSIYDRWRNDKNIEMLKRLDKNGVYLKTDSRLNVGEITNIFSGKSIVLTGSLVNLTRVEAKDRIRELGGNVSSTVSKNTNLLVAGAEPGSKLDKARELGVKIVDEGEFLSMVR